MCWLKRDRWKAGITIAGMLLLLLLMVWVPGSAVSADEGVSGLATPVTGTVQATPTVDPTMTALEKEKLAQEIDQLKNQNYWSWTTIGPILVGFAGLLAALYSFITWFRNRQDEQKKQREDRNLEREKRAEEQKRWLEDRQAERERRDEEQQRWLKDQEAEREKQAEERFQSAVEGLSSERKEAKIGAAILLRTFLRPDYKQFYTQTFDLAATNLRLRNVHPNTPEPLDPLSQALITVFKESFPLARDRLKGESSQFRPQSLVARSIQLDSAYLAGADLKQVWMPQASLREIDLSQADLSQANLNQANLSGTNLRGANLRGANLREANLHRANLRGAVLDQADLRGADLTEADLNQAQCTGANLTRANLTNANLMEMSAVGAILVQAFLSEARLMRANLMKANLTEARLMKADFTEASLVEANLTGAHLMEAHLTETDFTGANLANANLAQSNPEDATSLKGAKMHFVRGLTPDQRKACAHQGAEWSILEDFVASPDRSSPLPERPQSQDDTTLLFPTTSTQEGHSSPPPPSQSKDAQAPSAPLAQANTPSPDTGENGAASSQQGPEP